MNRMVGLLMAATLLVMPLSAHALTLKKGETLGADGQIRGNRGPSKLPYSWRFAVNFDTNSDIKKFDIKRLQNCAFKACSDGFIPAKILSETNGNKFLALSAKHGQLAHLGDGNSYRNELGTRMRDYNEFDLEGLTLWYGFRVKKPSAEKANASSDNTFTQIKQVTKIRKGNKKENCSKGVVFHMNEDGCVFNGDGVDYPTKICPGNLVTSDWTTYKIGIKFSYEADGWIKVYRNEALMWEDRGRNLITKFFPNCNSADIDLVGNHLRIGVYAKSKNPNALNTLHFDDFVSGSNESEVNKFLMQSSSPTKPLTSINNSSETKAMPASN